MIRTARVTITDHTHRPTSPCARPRRVPQGRTDGPVQLAGLGDILDTAAGSSALNCGLFHFGVFKPECWALAFGSTTAAQLANPELAYPDPAPPPAVKPPANWASGAAPASGANAQATVDEVIAEQSAGWKAVEDQFFTDVADENNAASDSSFWGQYKAWIIGGGAAAAVLMIASHHRSR
jgi:hypothetical protein